VSFAAITLCLATRRVFIAVVYFVIDSVRKLLDTPSYVSSQSEDISDHKLANLRVYQQS
jgi:hypothetical protein